MKKEVAQFIKSLGGKPSYSGKRKTMYINGDDSIELAVIDKFKYSLPFSIATNYHL